LDPGRSQSGVSWAPEVIVIYLPKSSDGLFRECDNTVFLMWGRRVIEKTAKRAKKGKKGQKQKIS
jgi:hypothetical protein